jgi:hypothetical protein
MIITMMVYGSNTIEKAWPMAVHMGVTRRRA